MALSWVIRFFVLATHQERFLCQAPYARLRDSTRPWSKCRPVLPRESLPRLSKDLWRGNFGQKERERDNHRKIWRNILVQKETSCKIILMGLWTLCCWVCFLLLLVWCVSITSEHSGVKISWVVLCRLWSGLMLNWYLHDIYISRSILFIQYHYLLFWYIQSAAVISISRDVRSNTSRLLA